MTMNYPETRSEDVSATLAGVSFPDPYQWLEQQDSEEVRSWQTAQAELATAHVREWRHFEQLRTLVEKLSAGQPLLLRFSAGRWFRTGIAEGKSHAVAMVSDSPTGIARVLFDPSTEDGAQPPVISWIAPSPDARTLALGICADGSEGNSIRLVDVATGELLPDSPAQPLMDNWTGGAHWLPDSSGFFFTACMGTAANLDQVVLLHSRLPVPQTACVDIPWKSPYRMVVVSGDGRHAVAFERMTNPIPVAVAALGESPLRWRPFITSIDGTVAGHAIGDQFIGITDVGAARGRLVSIPLDVRNPNDARGWRELLPESQAVMRTVTAVGKTLYLSEFVETYARVRVLDLDGRLRGEVPLPGRGALREFPLPMMNLAYKGHPNSYVFGFSSLTTSNGTYRHTPGQPEIEILQEPAARLDNCVVEDRWATSADGTRIPYHVMRRADLDLQRPHPTLIHAYGGFNVSLVPKFPGPMAAFVAMRGVLVHAHLRGGGEFGRQWWEGGRWKRKQNTYDDLYAIAEDLIADKRTTTKLLAVTGDSNGGQTAGVAVTQRPELWAVAVPRVPRLDLIGACRFSYGRQSNLEDRVTSLDDPEEARRLAEFSPYHLVRDGVRYPAVYLDVGDTDPRCQPGEARKFAARLQKASSGDAPVLLHVWENVGHGWATARKLAVLQHTEWLAFTLRHLGVTDLDSCVE
jgi:prolyl oligopeptidase